ncbi:hypothetical protein [Novosphingobium sp.]|uniref:hypothetical protein n=1 Tax=Novosphingobium sp. TaxID=1874826 RepID=UPI0031DA6CBC
MQKAETSHWATDADTFMALDGAKEVVAWFGIIPSFHDATLGRLEIGQGTAIMSLETFRMTSEVDSQGFFVLDKHATVTLNAKGVTGLALTGEASATIARLIIRRVSAKPMGWDNAVGPEVGDIEIGWESSWGMDGTIYAREVSLSLQPLP